MTSLLENRPPILLHMLGIPGAGKTTFLDCLLNRWPLSEPPYLLGFDQIMQSLSEYKAIPDKIAAFAACELPAREAGYLLLDKLIGEKKDILFDNGGSSATHIDILTDAKNMGYRIILVSIKTSIADAQKRVDDRAIHEGRHTPMTYLDDRAQKIDKLEANYRALTPHFYEMYNNRQDFAEFQATCINLANVILQDLN